MKQRLLVAAIGIPLFFLVFFLQLTVGYFFNAAIAAITIVALFEIFLAEHYINNKTIITVSYLYSALIPFVPIIEPYFDVNYEQITTYITLLFVAVLFFVQLIQYKTLRLSDIAVVFFVTSGIALFFGCVSRLAVGMTNGPGGTILPLGIFKFLLVFIGAWCTDAFALFMGKLFGRHKLAPNISPKKTVEGAVYGVILNTLLFVALGYGYQALIMPSVQVNLWEMALLGLLTGVAAVFGDLCLSAVKRQCCVKDFGSILPGHGGILDRFDSILFVAPVVFYYFTLFQVIN